MNFLYQLFSSSPSSKPVTTESTAADLMQLYSRRHDSTSEEVLEQGSKLVARYADPTDTLLNYSSKLTSLINAPGHSQGEMNFMRACCGLDAAHRADPNNLRRSTLHVMRETGVRLRRATQNDIKTLMDVARTSSGERVPSQVDEALRLTTEALRRAKLIFGEEMPQFAALSREVDALRSDPTSSRISGGQRGHTSSDSNGELPALRRGEAQRRLDNMVGLQAIKAQVRGLVCLAQRNRLDAQRGGRRPSPVSLNAFFGGRPGTGKTEVARLYGSLLKDAKMLRKGHVVVASKSDLVGSALGESGPKTRAAIERAQGGVLFVDEAHTLAVRSDDIYAKESINEIMQAMVSMKGQFAVIFATYTEKCEALYALDPGLSGRLDHQFEFPDYTDDELAIILTRMAAAQGFDLEEGAALKAASKAGEGRHHSTFDNARAMEAGLGQAQLRRAVRLADRPDDADILSPGQKLLTAEDFADIERRNGDHFAAEGKIAALEPGEGLRRLNAMVGLQGIKSTIEGFVARTKLERREAELHPYWTIEPSFLHSFFGGRPGTGKTQVARIYGSLLRDAGLLTQGHVITASKADLVASYLGQTQEKTRKVIDRALGGVLFVDEAHTLTDSSSDQYSRDAINELMQAMVQHKGNLAVVFATYTDKRQKLFELDGGLMRRIPTQLEFPDYTDDELATILMRMAASQNFVVAPDVAARAATMVGETRHQDSFGNAGAMESSLERARKMRALRLGAQGEAAGDPTHVPTERHLIDADFAETDQITGGHFSVAGKIAALPPGEATGCLERMVGLAEVKDEILSLVAMSQLNQVEGHNNSDDAVNLHVFFGGNPGTGKTQTARLYGSLLKDAGVLAGGHVIAVGRGDLQADSQKNANAKVQALVKSALGGVLFIDEAHLLCGDAGTAPATAAISELMQAMLTHQGELAVVFATYPQYQNALFNLDQGLKRRIGSHLKFPDFTDRELAQVARDVAVARGFTISSQVATAVGEHVGKHRNAAHYGNAGDINTAFDKAIKRRARRLTQGLAPGAAPVPQAIRQLDLSDFAETIALGESWSDDD